MGVLNYRLDESDPFGAVLKIWSKENNIHVEKTLHLAIKEEGALRIPHDFKVNVSEDKDISLPSSKLLKLALKSLSADEVEDVYEESKDEFDLDDAHNKSERIDALSDAYDNGSSEDKASLLSKVD